MKVGQNVCFLTVQDKKKIKTVQDNIRSFAEFIFIPALNENGHFFGFANFVD